jgi:hypothetical protein
MTYEEVTLRMVRSMFVEEEERWIDLSLRNLTGDWLRRVEERFAGVNGGGAKALVLQSFASLDNFVKDFFAKCSASSTQLLASEDKAYFLARSQRRGQKPVPFISILDADLEVWSKKVFYGIVSYYTLTYILYLRTHSGRPRISRPSTMPSSTPKLRTNPSKISWATLIPLSSISLSNMSIKATSARSRLLIT